MLFIPMLGGLRMSSNPQDTCVLAKAGQLRAPGAQRGTQVSWGERRDGEYWGAPAPPCPDHPGRHPFKSRVWGPGGGGRVVGRKAVGSAVQVPVDTSQPTPLLGESAAVLSVPGVVAVWEMPPGM